MSEPIVHVEFDDEPIFAWGLHLDRPNYNDAPEDYGDVMSIEDYLADVADGCLIDYDGHGYPMRDGKVAKGRNMGLYGEFVIRPSKGKDAIPKDATHIIWYNR